jgi:TonB family protein
MICLQQGRFSSTSVRRGAVTCCAALALGLALSAQQPEEKQQTPSSDATSPDAAQQSAPPAAPEAAAPAQSTAAEPILPGAVSEEELKRQLVGKPLYLRSGYLDNTLAFNEHGRLIGHSPQGSYTLSGIQIDKVRLTKHKVELEGARYGLHFVGQLAYEDPSKAVDRVRITPKKKVVKITIDRELVVVPKKKKENVKGKPAQPQAAAPTNVPDSAQSGAASSADAQTSAASASPASPSAEGQAAPGGSEMSEADQLKASIAAAPVAERPADPKSVTTTISPAHAAQVLKEAMDIIFASGLDDRMMAAMPDFWKLYYQAAAARTDYRPQDPSVLRQNTVDRKARLLTTFEPASNEFAQANGVAGMALYHTVIGADGKPGEIAVGRPIGFGLDENAVEAIRKASFDPAIKNGKPVPVLADLVVQFRIYSKRTAVAGQPDPADKTAVPILPGPYSVQAQ